MNEVVSRRRLSKDAFWRAETRDVSLTWFLAREGTRRLRFTRAPYNRARPVFGGEEK